MGMTARGCKTLIPSYKTSIRELLRKKELYPLKSGMKRQSSRKINISMTYHSPGIIAQRTSIKTSCNLHELSLDRAIMRGVYKKEKKFLVKLIQEVYRKDRPFNIESHTPHR